MKRAVYLAHRWLGIAICLFMAAWFVSGVVMLYIGYPKLSERERWQASPGLSSHALGVNLAAVLDTAKPGQNPQSIRLVTVAGQPRFILTYPAHTWVAVDAKSGRLVLPTTSEEAVQSARAFQGTDGDYLGQVNEDAWSHSRALDGNRPLSKVLMHDAEQTVLYVSGSTGEVVRDATGTERFWNWIGAWLHWLYPFRGGFFDPQAANIIIYSSLLGTVLAGTGLVVGVWRWRFKGRYKSGAKTPYRNGLMRWHHQLGLVFGLAAFTWVLSGLFSMNPWNLFNAPGTGVNLKAYAGGELEARHFPLPAADALTRFKETGFTPCELQWHLIDGKGYYLAFNNAGESRLLFAEKGSRPFARFDTVPLQAAAKQMFPSSQKVLAQTLTDYDFYYYPRAPHTMTGHIEKRLPLLRLKFDDAHSTWLHIDPYTGIPAKLDAYQRTSRWLFALLHSWDWLPLLNSRPLWDILLVTFSIGGAGISVSGIVLAARRLRVKRTTRHQSR